MHWYAHENPAANVGPSAAAVGPPGASGKAVTSRPSGIAPLGSIVPIGWSERSPSGATVTCVRSLTTVVVVAATNTGAVVVVVVGVTITGVVVVVVLVL